MNDKHVGDPHAPICGVCRKARHVLATVIVCVTCDLAARWPVVQAQR